jgi:hypothetical protein
MKNIKTFEGFWNTHDDWISYNFLDLDILERGHLKIMLNDNGKEEVKHMDLTPDNFYDLFEDIQANSEMMYFDDMSDVGLGMSSSPCITDGYWYSDDNLGYLEPVDDTARIFWYPNYSIKDFTEELVENGYVVFEVDKEKTDEEIERQKLKKDINKYNL